MTSRDIILDRSQGFTAYRGPDGREYMQHEPGNGHASEASAKAWARVRKIPAHLWHVERVRDFPNPDRYAVVAYAPVEPEA